MKRIPLILYICACFLSGNVLANESDKIYVDPTVAKSVIEKYFAHMVSEYSDFKSDEFNDDIVLIDVMNAYNNMLKANDGFVSVGGVVALCNVAFENFEKYAKSDMIENQNQLLQDKCMAFTKDLVFAQPAQKMDSGCPYTISKVDNSQLKIRYALPNNSGFIRNGAQLHGGFLILGICGAANYSVPV